MADYPYSKPPKPEDPSYIIPLFLVAFGILFAALAWDSMWAYLLSN